jgi:hypothetical protein
MALLKHNNNSISNVTSFALVPSGSPVLLATSTASSSASLSFNSTYINGDYQIYKFEFINMHPATDNVAFHFNLSTDNGSSYNVAKTTTWFRAFHHENDSNAALGYDGGDDLAQSTGFQTIFTALGGGNADESGSGSLTLFNPSSTTYVKHFIADGQKISCYHTLLVFTDYVAGYGSTTTAINAIQFKLSVQGI